MAQRGQGPNIRHNGGTITYIRTPNVTINRSSTPSVSSNTSSASSSRNPSPPTTSQNLSKDSPDIRNTFTRLDVTSKNLLYKANQLLKTFRERNIHDPEKVNDQDTIYDLMAQIKLLLDEMVDISDDMNAVKDTKISSPRLVDQAKTYTLTVDSLKTSLKQLQRDFQLAITSKERQDLFTLSRSPFADNGIRRRGAGAAEISSGATESMLHSRRILLETVQRSAGTIGTLANSSTAIQENQEELKSQNSLISVSKKLLTKYGRREFTDKILICLALVFFLACVVYVVQKRIF
ncbi:vesicle transport protein SEC20 [Folsomia candida]|uniref:vesicle transport protein SEC20 n=1 Tax=Folsomia candida TaxID=158441 RepID=UPI000B8EF09F|nr:vesicle transport protein SEC20 [Folsomia candida]XP_035708573.1 vesicle transport protein SEC20 [Folsomia candida]